MQDNELVLTQEIMEECLTPILAEAGAALEARSLTKKTERKGSSQQQQTGSQESWTTGTMLTMLRQAGSKSVSWSQTVEQCTIFCGSLNKIIKIQEANVKWTQIKGDKSLFPGVFRNKSEMPSQKIYPEVNVSELLKAVNDKELDLTIDEQRTPIASYAAA